MKYYFIISFSFYISSCFSQKFENECKNSTLKIKSLLSDLSSCFVSNSVNGNSCINCVSGYYKLKEYEYYLKNVLVQNGQNCFDLYFKSDKYKTIELLINNMSITWNNLHCDICFDKLSKNFTPPNNYTVYNEKFMVKFHIFLNCIENSTEKTIYICDRLNMNYGNKSFNQTICNLCQKSYKIMFGEYAALKLRDNDMRVCGDIENYLQCSRETFEKDFNCTNFPINDLIQLANIGPVMASIGTLLIFYLCTKLGFRDKAQIEIYQQQRVIPASNNGLTDQSINLSSNPGYQSEDDYFRHVDRRNDRYLRRNSPVFMDIPTRIYDANNDNSNFYK